MSTKPLIALLAATALFAAVPAYAPAAAPSTLPSLPATQPVEGDDRFDPETDMVRVPFRSPGYHTRIANGAVVHPTLNAMIYALQLLESPDPARHARASRVIAKVLTLQDTDPASPTYGTWPWMLEEPLAQMSSPDMNWAAFIGSRLTQAMILYPTRLTPAVRDDASVAIRHASRSIMRRNVGESYTNIAVMSFGTACAAGEFLNDPEILAWGREKLNRFAEYTRRNGGFTEYNSPAYIPVGLRELERLLLLAKSPDIRAQAEALRREFWRSIADHFHPGTAQWAGPHARAYYDLLEPATAQTIADATGLTIAGRTPRPATGPAFLPCPPELVERFRTLPSDPLTVVSRFRTADTDRDTLVGTTWLAADACLGSINRDSLWTQRRPLLAYWTTAPGNPPAVLRARFLKDGKDFASATIITAQSGQRIAAAFRLASNLGDWHISLDRPKDRTFTAGDLRIRIELTAIGATARQIRPGTFELAAGTRRAVLHTAAGSAAESDQPMQWQLGQDDAKTPRVWLDGIYRTGAPLPLKLDAARNQIAGLGLELLSPDDQPADTSPTLAPDGRVSWSPGPVELKTPLP